MDVQQPSTSPPEILAPAGNKASFLAAVAAGADAVYCGLKLFSARMEAKNFTIEEFTALIALAHGKGVKVFVAVNSLLKPDDLMRAGQFLDLLQRRVKPDAIIIQDLGMVSLIKQTGFSGEIHLSTLANASFPTALQVIRQHLQVDRVVLPRELNVDELRFLSRVCPTLPTTLYSDRPNSQIFLMPGFKRRCPGQGAFVNTQSSYLENRGS